MKKHRFLSLLLAILLSTSLLTACGDDPDTGSADTTSAAEETPAPETVPEWALPDMDFGGESVTFILRRTPDDWSADDVIAAEMNGTPINDAVFTRNSQVEETYNVQIVGIDAPLGHSIYDPVINSIMAGDQTFDVSASYQYDAINLMMENVLYDLHETEYIQLERDWWNPFYNESASMMGRQYYALGDISRVYKLGVRCLFFNKDLAENLHIGNLYDMVQEGKWDFETFFSTAELGNIDLDGNGAMDDADCYGIQAQSSLGIVLAMGGNLQITGKDADDYPILTVQTEANQETMERISSLLNTNKALIHTSDNWLNTQNRFSAGQVLFQAEVMLLIEALRASEVDVGILPMPKYDLQQENYISFLDGWCQNVCAIPTTCTNTEKVSFVLEAMAQGSLDTLTPAFYDICLNGKYIRDEKSSDMLDIIFAYCRTESAETFGWGNLYGNLNAAISKGTTSSAIQSGSAAAEAAIEKTLSTMKSNLGIE